MKVMPKVVPARGEQITVGIMLPVPAEAEDTDHVRMEIARQGEQTLRAQWRKTSLSHLVMSFKYKLRGDNGCVLVVNTVSAMDPRGVRYIKRFREDQRKQREHAQRKMRDGKVPRGT